MTSSSIHLLWDPPPIDTQNGIIRHYSVIIFAEGSFFKTEKASGTTLLLQDLHPFYSYHFTVCAVTVALGSCSTFDATTFSDGMRILFGGVHVHVNAFNQCYYCLAPSGSPVMIDIEAINSSSLRLTWEEPPAEQQNGVIISHSISVTVLETEERLSFTVAGTRFELHNLHPFYTYSATIAAATVNGTGPYSAVFSIQLPPDGELLCVGYNVQPAQAPSNVSFSALVRMGIWNETISSSMLSIKPCLEMRCNAIVLILCLLCSTFSSTEKHLY